MRQESFHSVDYNQAYRSEQEAENQVRLKNPIEFHPPISGGVNPSIPHFTTCHYTPVDQKRLHHEFGNMKMVRGGMYILIRRMVGFYVLLKVGKRTQEALCKTLWNFWRNDFAAETGPRLSLPTRSRRRASDTVQTYGNMSLFSPRPPSWLRHRRL